jgi:hypothetical protein
MSYLGLLVDFGASGRIAGVGLGSRPADWPLALGDEYFEASWRPGHLVRQFGFVDAHFEDDSGDWICHLIQIAPYKVNVFPDMVPQPVAQQYGAFPERIPFADVAAALVGANVDVFHLGRVHEAALETYWVPASKVMFWVISPYQANDHKELRVGDVYSVSTDSHVDAPRSTWTKYAA